MRHRKTAKHPKYFKTKRIKNNRTYGFEQHNKTAYPDLSNITLKGQCLKVLKREIYIHRFKKNCTA